ncbi:MAG: hypothetical protein NT034_02405 [Candidatus Magasanikbacteria bacterium]|nr:hypothetical protein [Candidatus Magasanikbacteria bacterium]
MQYISDVYFWTAARLVMGFIFLWAFFDKLFGLGFATTSAQAWINGGSPTQGFLKMGVTGPFSGFFHQLSGSIIVDCLFMVGLLMIGTTLILGVALKISSFAGAVLVFLMWVALLVPKNNPIFDEHIVYLIIFLGLGSSTIRSEDYFGLGKWWKSLKIVRDNSFLE